MSIDEGVPRNGTQTNVAGYSRACKSLIRQDISPSLQNDPILSGWCSSSGLVATALRSVKPSRDHLITITAAGWRVRLLIQAKPVFCELDLR